MESRTVIAVTLQPGLDNDLVMRTTACLLWIHCPADGGGLYLPASGLDWENPYREDTDQHHRAAATIAATTHRCYMVVVLDEDAAYLHAGLSRALEVRKQENIGNILILIDGDFRDIVNDLLEDEKQDVKGIRIEDMAAFTGKHFLSN